MHALIRFVLPSLVFLVSTTLQASDAYEAGEELYDLSCAHCHGKNLVNPGTSSFDLKKFPLDEKERFMTSVKNGKGFMPGLEGVLDEEEFELIWIYINENR